MADLYISRWVKPWDAYMIAATEWTEECVIVGVTMDRYLKWRRAWKAQRFRLQAHGILKYLHGAAPATGTNEPNEETG
ncbi:hypothetical protein LCGC14_1364320 [marine sediment metagenome]|uniref:Uncharacterized protein n=1 Tax=marine sediment metagenome TaxID=412755 RepID=A0A0F9K791_9ZZZZ